MRSHPEYVEGNLLVDMIQENLVAERMAIDSYGEIIRYLGSNDPTSRRVMEEILAKEEEHADDLKALPQNSGLTRRIAANSKQELRLFSQEHTVAAGLWFSQG